MSALGCNDHDKAYMICDSIDFDNDIVKDIVDVLAVGLCHVGPKWLPLDDGRTTACW